MKTEPEKTKFCYLDDDKAQNLAFSALMDYQNTIDPNIGKQHASETSMNLSLIATFMLTQYKNLSYNDLVRAFEYNDSGKIARTKTPFGNKINRGFVGEIMNHYKQFRHLENRNQPTANLTTTPTPVQDLIGTDLFKIRFYGNTYVVTGDINAKFTYLKAHREDFYAFKYEYPGGDEKCRKEALKLKSSKRFGEHYRNKKVPEIMEGLKEGVKVNLYLHELSKQK